MENKKESNDDLVKLLNYYDRPEIEEFIVDCYLKNYHKCLPHKIKMRILNGNIINTAYHFKDLNIYLQFLKRGFPDLSKIYDLLYNENLIVISLPICKYKNKTYCVAPLTLSEITENLNNNKEILIYSIDIENNDTYKCCVINDDIVYDEIKDNIK